MSDGLRLDEQLCFALYAASRAVTQTYQPYLAQLDLTYPQYLVMLVLWEQDGLTVKNIGEKLLLDSGTLTPLLKRLETIGYVNRRRGTQDERQVLVYLSESGKALRRQAVAMRAEMSCRFAAPLAEAQGLREALRMLLVRLQQNDVPE